MKERHKWNGGGRVRATSNKGGYAALCLKCGCVREYVKGIAIFFIGDTCYNTSPDCKMCREKLQPTQQETPTP